MILSGTNGGRATESHAPSRREIEVEAAAAQPDPAEV